MADSVARSAGKETVVPEWLVDGWAQLAIAAAKAALMYVIALVGLSLAHRRTLSRWTAIDFAAAVAPGAIIGRTAIANGQSVAVACPPQAQVPGSSLAVARQQALLQLHGAHRGREVRTLAHRPEGSLEEGQLEARVVGEEHAPVQCSPQLGQHLRERPALLEVVVGEAVDRDRAAGVVVAHDVAAAPGEVDARAVDRHPSHSQHPVAAGVEPGRLEVHRQQGEPVERGPVVGRHVSSRTG